MKRLSSLISPNYKVADLPASYERQHTASTMKDKSCLGYVVTVFKNITVQGLAHFTYTRRHFAEHIIWMITLVLCVLCTISLCNETWRRYKDNPTVISLERDSMAWNISFPAIFICPSTKYDEVELEKLVGNLSENSNASPDVLRSYLKALANLTYENMHDMKQFEGAVGLPETGLLDKVEKIQFKFEHRYESKEKNKFHQRLYKTMTENGICYAQNSLLTPTIALEKLNIENTDLTPVTYTMRASKSTQISKMKTDYKRLNNSGAIGSLSEFTAARLVHRAELAVGFTVHYDHRRGQDLDQVYVESSTEVPTWLSVPRNYQNDYEVILSITVRTMHSTDAVRELDVHHRKCRFFDESDLKISPKYSYNLCMMQCRKDMVLKWCHCSPYFYGKLGKITECGVEGMLCIANLIDKLRGLTDKTCNCYQSCDLDSYGILKEKLSAVYDGADFFGGTRFEWELPEFPNIRLKKDILFSSTNLLEAFGGTVNLFLGASILSGIEVIYYCTIRLAFYFFRKNYLLH